VSKVKRDSPEIANTDNKFANQKFKKLIYKFKLKKIEEISKKNKIKTTKKNHFFEKIKSINLAKIKKKK
jgi:hypothetical protein